MTSETTILAAGLKKVDKNDPVALLAELNIVAKEIAQKANIEPFIAFSYKLDYLNKLLEISRPLGDISTHLNQYLSLFGSIPLQLQNSDISSLEFATKVEKWNKIFEKLTEKLQISLSSFVLSTMNKDFWPQNEARNFLEKVKIELHDMRTDQRVVFIDIFAELKAGKKLIDDFEKQASKSLDNLKVSFENREKENINKSEEYLDKLNNFVIQGKNLAHYQSGHALSEFFNERAESEAKSVLYWTIATWFFAITTLAALGFIFYIQFEGRSTNKEIDLPFLGTKVLFTATLGFIAKWTSKRANRHLAEESKYRRLSINTHTIDSFIAQLKDESKEEVMKAVALKMFTETEGNETPTDYGETNIVDYIKKAISSPK